jgi:RNA polymerase sigma-70 factor (ECF subfamily)
MAEDAEFASLLRRVRGGDEEAATRLVQRYEPAIRRVVRMRLADSNLRRRLDSMDICQSVLASFFVRAALGQYELRSPADLVKLLGVMARNKVADQARKPRIPRQAPAAPGDFEELASAGPSPSHQAAMRDLLEQVRAQLTEEERQIAERRALGREWTEIAAELGGSPEALRKQLARALDRVARQLKLDD